PTPRGKRRWNPSTVRNILRSPLYYGMAAYGRTRPVPARRRKSALEKVGPGVSTQPTPPEEWVMIAVPAIVSREVFDVAQRRLNQNKQMARRNNSAHEYLLRSLVSCGCCQLTCTGREVSPAYTYYVCAGRSNTLRRAAGERCYARYIPAQALDKLVWQDLCQVLREPALLTHELMRAQGGEWLPQSLQAQRKTVQQALAQLERQQARLLEVYLAEVIGLSEFERKRQELSQTQEGLQAQLRHLDAQTQQHLDLMGLSDGLKAFCSRVAPTLDHLDFSQRRQLIELLIDRVIVADGAVEIRYVVPTSPKGEVVPFCHLRLDYFNVHPFEIMAQHPAIGVQIGHHHTQFCRTLCRGARPGDRNSTAPIRLTREPDIREVAPLTGLDAKLVNCNLTAVTEGDIGVIGNPNNVIPAQRTAFAGPITITKPAIGQKGHASGARKQLGNMVQHGFTDRQFYQAGTRDYFPSQRQRTVAVRERDAQHLECLTIDEATIQHDRDLAADP